MIMKDAYLHHDISLSANLIGTAYCPRYHEHARGTRQGSNRIKPASTKKSDKQDTSVCL